MKKICLFVLLYTFANSSFGQNTHKNAVKWVPSTLINLAGKPGIELQYERFLGERTADVFEFIYITDLTKNYTIL